MKSSQEEKLRLRLPVPTEKDEGNTAIMDIDGQIPVHENGEFLKALSLMLAVSVGKKNLAKLEKWMLVEACEKHRVMPEEMYRAFWKAYGDPYVGKEGIQFRHLWKHIQKERYGQEGRTFTYEQMLDYCDKKNCSTDVFSLVDEKDDKGRPMWVIK